MNEKPTSQSRLSIGKRTTMLLDFRRSPRTAWAIVGSVVVLVVGILLSCVGFRLISARDAAQQQERFVGTAHRLEADLAQSFELPVEMARSIRGLFSVSDNVSAQQFERFVGDALLRFPAVSLLEWAPVVPHSERAAFEQRASELSIPGFRILEEGAGGQLVPAQQRDLYVPLLHILPTTNAPFGFDVVSEPWRRMRVAEVDGRAGATATGRFRLVEDPEGVWSIAVYHPVRERAGDVRSRVRGYAIVIFRLQTVLESTLRNFGPEHIRFVLRDITEPDQSELLFESPDIPADRAADRATEFEYYGRRWYIESWDPRPRRPGLNAYLLLVSGVLLTLLIAGALLSFGLVGQLRKQVMAARRLGRYELIEKIGEGGMGSVYRASHSLLKRDTAVKVLRSQQDPQAQERFEREVQLTARLTHPNTVVVYDYGHTRTGEFYYVMELLDGLNLHQIVRKHGPMPPARVAHVLRQVAGALTEAHEIGLIHRDIKPENIMLTCRGKLADFAKILDFGLVRKLDNDDGDVRITREHAVMGTPHYVAPEAVQLLPYDGRADVYSLSAVAYYLLTGTDVYSGRTAIELMNKHVTETPEPPSQRLGRAIPLDLENLILRGLRKNPDERPTMGEFYNELDQIRTNLRWTSREAWAWWTRHRPESLQHQAMAQTLPVAGMKLRPLDVEIDTPE